MTKNKSKPMVKRADKPVSITSERKDIVSKLQTKKWYKNTNPKIKRDLISLPEDFNGFLIDLSNRPETIGNVEVLNMKKLSYGNYHIVPVFAVRSILTNEKFTYEYFSWKYGRYPGYRSLILIEFNGEIKFFIIKKGCKFAVANQVYDAIGTFVTSYPINKLINLPKSINNQLMNLLELKDIHFHKIIDLGILNPDAAATNNHTALFAAVVNINDAEKINRFIDGRQFRTLALGFELEIHPIERISEYVMKSDDSFFLAIVARLIALNIIKP